MGEPSVSLHERTFETFARRARESLGESVHGVIPFGSTVRGETRGTDSDGGK